MARYVIRVRYGAHRVTAYLNAPDADAVATIADRTLTALAMAADWPDREPTEVVIHQAKTFRKVRHPRRSRRLR